MQFPKKIDVKLWLLLGAFIDLAILMGLAGPQSTLDKRFYYSGEEARAFFGALTLDQRSLYLSNEWIDLAFIAVYSLLIHHLLWSRIRAKWRWLIFVPSALDLMETLVILGILVGFHFHNALDYLGMVTCAKWSLGIPLILVALRTLFFSCRKFDPKSY